VERHVMSAVDWKTRRSLSATRLMSSAKYVGAKSDNDWCTRHAIYRYIKSSMSINQLINQSINQFIKNTSNMHASVRINRTMVTPGTTACGVSGFISLFHDRRKSRSLATCEQVNQKILKISNLQ